MSLLMPDRHGRWSTEDDSRLSLDASAIGGFLKRDYGFVLIGCGNPTLIQATYAEGGAAVSNNGIIELFGNYATGVNDNFGLQFRSYAQSSLESRFNLRFKSTGGSFLLHNVYSPVVTPDNCDTIIIEKNFDNWALHLLSKDGVLTRGDYLQHSSNVAALTLGPATEFGYNIWLGGMAANLDVDLQQQWKAQLGSFILVESDTSFTDLDPALIRLGNGASPVDEFGVDNVLMWRTLADKSPASLSAHPTATSDVVAPFVLPASERLLVGSPIGYSGPVDGIRVDERKYTFRGVLAGESVTDVPVSGKTIGNITSVEVRLLRLDDLSVAVDWTDLGAPVSGEFSGSLLNVSPGEYCIEARDSANHANIYQGRNPWVVTYVMAIMGQSQNHIAINDKDGMEAGFNFEQVPDTARAYLVSFMINGTYGHMPYVMRMDGQDDYSDALLYAQIEWEKDHPGLPVIWANLSIGGQEVERWLNNDEVYPGYRFVGDGVTFLSGVITDFKLALGSDKVNIIWSWGTADLPDEDYENKIRGYFFNEGVGFTGPTFNHINELFHPNFGLGQLPLTRHITNAPDNYVAGQTDDNGRTTVFRELQLAIATDWKNNKPNKVVLGPSVNDMSIQQFGGPHQPEAFEGEAYYMQGNPRLGSRYGMLASWLVSDREYTLPKFTGAGYTDGSKTAFRIAVDQGSFGALQTVEGGSVFSGIEISEDSGVSWSRNGFLATFDGQGCLVSKSSGDWTGLAPGVLMYRYHKGGPYSYGLNFRAEMTQDIDRALFASYRTKPGLGAPIPPLTNNESGFVVAETAPPSVLTVTKVSRAGRLRKFGQRYSSKASLKPSVSNLSLTLSNGSSVTVTPEIKTLGQYADIKLFDLVGCTADVTNRDINITSSAANGHLRYSVRDMNGSVSVGKISFSE